ncbi:MAG TPA: SRPBCC family protein, partial [Burkholderiales bacterium]|nr:SRPBCC family protein [Burkholderiales bacterium]
MIRVRRSAVIDAPIERVWAVLRDFNSHSAWHPAVGDSRIERDEPSDQVGCVRNFFLKDGNHIREQLLALSDRDYVSTYCILDATLPMKNYVATVQLKRITDGARTFWHWESTFDVPKGREREFEQLVGGGVYEAGFAALARYLNGDGPRVRPQAVESQGVVATGFGGPEVLQLRKLETPRGEVVIRQTAIGVNYIDIYVRKGLYRMIEPPAPIGMEAAGVVVASESSRFRPGDRAAYACTPPGSYATMRALP